MSDPLHQRLVDMVRRSPTLMTVLTLVRDRQLPDPLLFSGAVYQTVWNDLTGRPHDYGIKDYDVGYFDADLSLAAEDRVIQELAEALDEPLRDRVEVRNQARVHLWVPEKFGHPYAPLATTADALTRFVCPAFAVGIRLEEDDRVTVEAPFGLHDVFTMRLRPNPLRGTSADWDRIIDSAVTRWPELQVELTPATLRGARGS